MELMQTRLQALNPFSFILLLLLCPFAVLLGSEFATIPPDVHELHFEQSCTLIVAAAAQRLSPELRLTLQLSHDAATEHSLALRRKIEVDVLRQPQDEPAGSQRLSTGWLWRTIVCEHGRAACEPLLLAALTGEPNTGYTFRISGLCGPEPANGTLSAAPHRNLSSAIAAAAATASDAPATAATDALATDPADVDFSSGPSDAPSDLLQAPPAGSGKAFRAASVRLRVAPARAQLAELALRGALFALLLGALVWYRGVM